MSNGWDEIFNELEEKGQKWTLKHYGDGMHTATVDNETESDLTFEEAQDWMQARIKP